MSVKQNKAVVRGYIEPPQGWKEMNRQIQTAADPVAFIEKDSREVHAKYFSPELILHTPMGDMSNEEFMQVDIDTLTNMRDVSYTVEDMIGEGDKVMARYTMRGVSQGPVMGFPASGKPIQVSGIMVFKLAKGKIIEAWGISDIFGLMQQIGALPPAK